MAKKDKSLRRLLTTLSPLSPNEMLDLIYWRDGGRCRICDRMVAKSEATKDHILPVRLGGLNEPENLRLCCKPCNDDLSSAAGCRLLMLLVRRHRFIKPLPVREAAEAHGYEAPLPRPKRVDRVYAFADLIRRARVEMGVA